MFDKSLYMARRDGLRMQVGSGLVLFLGNEEDAVITADGYRILGKKKPLTIEEVESVVRDLEA